MKIDFRLQNSLKKFKFDSKIQESLKACVKLEKMT